jgi:hypothetical protein
MSCSKPSIIPIFLDLYSLQLYLYRYHIYLQIITLYFFISEERKIEIINIIFKIDVMLKLVFFML